MQSKETSRIERLKAIVSAMPEKPGSYQYYDANGVIIYVGKAKNLKRRVSSYFHAEVDRFKTKVLVSKIHNITYTVVNSEEDALLLENQLIKKYNPHYNVLLKDGKTYPSICITGEYFPRIFKTRTINRRFGTYYGPYSNLGSMYTILDLIRKLYHPRSCRMPITRESIALGKHKPCLEYHIKNCGAPCCGKQSWENYQENISRAREILKGNTREIREHTYAEMMKAAEELRFEDAEELKKDLLLIEQFVAKSEVVSNTITDVDIFTTNNEGEDSLIYINYMHVKNGAINQSFTFEYKRKADETIEELLASAIVEIRNRFHSNAKEILVPYPIEWSIPGAEFFIPQRGDKHHLLELSLMNCRQYRIDRLKQSDKLNPEKKYTRLMQELQEKLKLPKIPYHIELFDNSNISGSDAVAGCVVYKGMNPSKKDYRKYTIKTVNGPDDYASMREVMLRRYNPKMLETESYDTNNTIDVDYPDLIIADGGAGQMHSIAEIVWGELGLKQINIAGLAKNDKHRTNELLYLTDSGIVTVQIPTNTELFHTLSAMQEEVHRYAITFHRDKRSKHALHSELDDIAGIGPKTRDILIKKYKSVKRLKEVIESGEIDLLIELIGNSKATIIINHLKNYKHNGS